MARRSRSSATTCHSVPWRAGSLGPTSSAMRDHRARLSRCSRTCSSVGRLATTIACSTSVEPLPAVSSSCRLSIYWNPWFLLKAHPVSWDGSAQVDGAHRVIYVTGGTNERGSGTGWHAQGRVRDDIGREAQAMGYQRPALHRLGGLPRQGLSGRSEPALRVAEYGLVRAGYPALERRWQDLAGHGGQVRLRRRARHAQVV